MSGCVVQVWFEVANEADPRPPRFQIIETEMPDFATFCELVDGDRLIGGAILETERGGGRHKTISNRIPCAFRGASVMRCQLPTWTFSEKG